jgi:hypothetical protein
MGRVYYDFDDWTDYQIREALKDSDKSKDWKKQARAMLRQREKDAAEQPQSG